VKKIVLALAACLLFSGAAKANCTQIRCSGFWIGVDVWVNNQSIGHLNNGQTWSGDLPPNSLVHVVAPIVAPTDFRTGNGGIWEIYPEAFSIGIRYIGNCLFQSKGARVPFTVYQFEGASAESGVPIATEKKTVHPERAYFSQVIPQQSATPRIF